MGKRGKRSRGGAGGRRVPRAKNVFGEAARKLPLAQPPSLHRAGQDHNHRRVGGEVDLQEDRPCGGLQVHHHAGEVPEAVALRGQTHPWPHQVGYIIFVWAEVFILSRHKNLLTEALRLLLLEVMLTRKFCTLPEKILLKTLISLQGGEEPGGGGDLRHQGAGAEGVGHCQWHPLLQGNQSSIC